ncbi:hypothetical protein LIER_05661 [Lithospermum erythrorhizon]|uniref:Uncharacterized protein n=1 Tax=Lithospermum erythrorhizon TaxID=34254 RepID=A0AAV3P1J1_LITER
MGRSQAAHSTRSGAVVPVSEGNLHQVWGAPGASHRQRDSIHSWKIINRTTPNPITGETPFSLIYGSDALLPMEIHKKTSRVSYYDALSNEQGLRLNLDLLEEKRAAAVDKMARQTSAHGKSGKLESPWEGPYIIRRVVGPVTYEQKPLEGRQVPQPWNAYHLRKYYV